MPLLQRQHEVVEVLQRTAIVVIPPFQRSINGYGGGRRTGRSSGLSCFFVCRWFSPQAIWRDAWGSFVRLVHAGQGVVGGG